MQSHIGLSQEKSHPKPPPLPPTQYFIDPENDGAYEEIQLDNVPVPLQGKENFNRQFYSMIKYPASAREMGIKGSVVLQALVDEEGKVLNVEILKSLSRECDEAARQAFIQATAPGYAPLIMEAKPIKYKMTVPVLFWLQ